MLRIREALPDEIRTPGYESFGFILEELGPQSCGRQAPGSVALASALPPDAGQRAGEHRAQREPKPGPASPRSSASGPENPPASSACAKEVGRIILSLAPDGQLFGHSWRCESRDRRGAAMLFLAARKKARELTGGKVAIHFTPQDLRTREFWARRKFRPTFTIFEGLV